MSLLLLLMLSFCHDVDTDDDDVFISFGDICTKLTTRHVSFYSVIHSFIQASKFVILYFSLYKFTTTYTFDGYQLYLNTNTHTHTHFSIIIIVVVLA